MDLLVGMSWIFWYGGHGGIYSSMVMRGVGRADETRDTESLFTPVCGDRESVHPGVGIWPCGHSPV